MTIRIHEADGTPYEHVLDIRSPFKRYEVPFNTKYKRVRRNTKRYLARQAAAQAAAEGDAEAAEAIGMIDMGFGLEIWENEKERENWRVADWTEEEEQNMSGATYEWIRMDADFEWIASIGFDQPDFMWVSQLQRDRDVVAQLEVYIISLFFNYLLTPDFEQAVRALAKKPTSIVASTLTKTVLVANYFFRVRCEAALALVNVSSVLVICDIFIRFRFSVPSGRLISLDFSTYLNSSCDTVTNPKILTKSCFCTLTFLELTIFRTSQNTLFGRYVAPSVFQTRFNMPCEQSLLKAISRVRFEDGKTPVVVRRFLIDQVRYNDNTANPVRFLLAFTIVAYGNRSTPMHSTSVRTSLLWLALYCALRPLNVESLRRRKPRLSRTQRISIS
jgi:transcription initiation factor TFIID subunit 2